MQLLSAIKGSVSRLIEFEAVEPPHGRKDDKVARVALIAIYSLGAVLCTALSVHLAQPLWLIPALFFAVCAIWAYTWNPDGDSSTSRNWSWSLFTGNGSSSSWDSGPSYSPWINWSGSWSGGRSSRGAESWGAVLRNSVTQVGSGERQIPGLSSAVQSVVTGAVNSVASSGDGRQVPGVDSRR